jgi:hypothetical protein
MDRLLDGGTHEAGATCGGSVILAPAQAMKWHEIHPARVAGAQ